MGSMLDFRERLDGSVASLVARIQVGHVLLIVFVLLLVHIVYLTCLHPLRSVPGPPLAKVTVLWKVFRYARGQWHTDIANLHRQYGRVVRIAPNEVSFVDKDALIKIYGHASGTRKTSWYDVWTQPGASTGFFSATDPREHAFLRKRVSAAYSMSTILSLESEIASVGRLVWSRLDDMATKRAIVNLQHWTAYFAFDVVCALGIGGPLGFLEQGIDVQGIIKSIHDLFFMSSIFGDIPGQMAWLRNPITQALSRLAGHTSSSAGRDFATWLFSQVQDRMQAPSDPKRHSDMLDHFISMKEADGRSVDFPGVVVEAGNLIGAGADTTSAGISSVLGELVRHPEDYKAVQRELDEVYVRGDLQAHGTIDYKTAEKLSWLSACVKEALRLTPSIVWQLPRHVPEQGITIDGYYIPASAVVSLSPYAANRDEIVFGDDASEWNPARYIVGNKGVTNEYIRNIEKFNTTFGYGSRTCIGRNLALVETYRFVAEFCHRYDVAPVNTAAPYRTISQWFVVNKDFNVVLERRQSVKE